ncbi:RDD family protein [Dyella caseinilytica]|uniref:RDD family protein n=1 Tax=Dyella caseinilytica TaxID=1849581 RepID=A0ABX7GU25_9GAMM|nr:RDD family protein [Dyella caseinilytica]QRN53959.1 RDD family protein [Dyella caseinilytica]GFZ90460.1 RDD family protein [Dyella caseinilytica]
MEVWIGRQGERHGPYQEEQIKEWLRSGQLSREDLGWYDGLADWQPLSVLFPLEKPTPPPAPDMYAPPPPPQPSAGVAAFHYAGFWQRFGAWIIDIIVLMIPSMIAMYLLGGMEAYRHLMEQVQAGSDMAEAFRQYGEATESSQIASLGMTFVYYVLFEASKFQATPGKLALRLRVTDLNGQRISIGRAAARNVVRVLGLIFGLIPIICYLAIAWTQRKQGLHDLMASTLVLNGSAQEQPPQRPQRPQSGSDHGRFDA